MLVCWCCWRQVQPAQWTTDDDSAAGDDDDSVGDDDDSVPDDDDSVADDDDSAAVDGQQGCSCGSQLGDLNKKPVGAIPLALLTFVVFWRFERRRVENRR